MNPDVEIAGNNRNNDLKRQYSETNGIIFPTVYSLKKLIKNLKKKYHLLYTYIDVNIFLYFLHGYFLY